MASSTLKGLVANSGKLGYQLWHRPLKMASLVYEREIGSGERESRSGEKEKKNVFLSRRFSTCVRRFAALVLSSHTARTRKTSGTRIGVVFNPQNSVLFILIFISSLFYFTRLTLISVL